jgi:hypothetical protein
MKDECSPFVCILHLSLLRVPPVTAVRELEHEELRMGFILHPSAFIL